MVGVPCASGRWRQHFYLYDDSSSDQLRTTIGPHVTQGLVTLYSRFDVTMGFDGPRRNASGSHMMVAGESSRAGREQCNYRKRHGLYHVWDKGTCYIGLLFPLQSYMVAHAVENHGEDAAYLGFFDVDVRAPVANKHSLRCRPKCAPKSAGVFCWTHDTRPHQLLAIGSPDAVSLQVVPMLQEGPPPGVVADAGHDAFLRHPPKDNPARCS